MFVELLKAVRWCLDAISNDEKKATAVPSFPCIINQVAGNLLTHIYFSHFTYLIHEQTHSTAELHLNIAYLWLLHYSVPLETFFYSAFTLYYSDICTFSSTRAAVAPCNMHPLVCRRSHRELCGVEIEQTKKKSVTVVFISVHGKWCKVWFYKRLKQEVTLERFSV